LSANRISKEEKTDSNEEASAVLAALRAENENATKVTSHVSVRKTTPATKQVIC